jgi:hypothetical protein
MLSSMSLDKANRSHGSSHKSHEHGLSPLDKPVNGQQRQSRSERQRSGSKGKTQSFKIYTGDSQDGSRPKAVAMTVPKKARNQDCEIPRLGTFVPQNAASGLARTATQGHEERRKTLHHLSQVFPPKSELNGVILKEITAISGQEISKDMSQSDEAPAVYHDAPIAERAECGQNPSNTDSNASKNSEVERATLVQALDADVAHEEVEEVADGETTNLLTSANDEKDFSASMYDCHEDGTERRTLRSRLSSINILNRKSRHEDADPLPEDSCVNLAKSRRRSMLLLFR